MNIKNSLFLSALSVVALTSCVSENEDLNKIGKEMGAMELNVDIVQPETRSVTEVDNFPVVIYDAEGNVVESWDAVSDVPSKITMSVGNYNVVSHTPGKITKKMNNPYYQGSKAVEVVKGITSEVEVLCKMENSPISVVYEEDFKDVFSSWTITINDGDNTVLSFDKDSPSAPVYWYFGENGAPVLTVNFSGTTVDGSTVVARNTLTKDQADESYRDDRPNFVGGDALTLNFKPVESTDGKINSITINASVTFTETNENVNVVVVDKSGMEPGGEKKPNELAFSKSTASGVVGQEFVSPTLNNPNNLTLTWSSSDPTVATVNQSGVVALVAAGETTIKAIFAGDDEYEAGSVQYTLKVESQSGGDDKITLNLPNNLTVSAATDKSLGDTYIKCENGIKSIKVNIVSDNDEMIESLEDLDTNYGVNFITGAEIVDNQSVVDLFVDLNQPLTVPSQGDIDYTFPIGNFFGLLAFLSGEHTFYMTVEDMEGNKKNGVLVLTVE